MADRIRAALAERGYRVVCPNATNQIFGSLTEEDIRRLSEFVVMGFWENTADGRTTMRIATSWATDEKDVDALIGLL